MDGMAFAHDGKSGHWIYSIRIEKSQDDVFCASADISLRGEPRCKLVVSQPNVSRAAGVEVLKARCLVWIADFELGDGTVDTSMLETSTTG